jgi:hypothetical protein
MAMNKITISGDQHAGLSGDGAPTEVYDPNGQLVGYLVPPQRYAKLRAAKDAADLAELERRAENPDLGTLQELWKELGVE